jgi:hypothetical protein
VNALIEEFFLEHVLAGKHRVKTPQCKRKATNPSSMSGYFFDLYRGSVRQNFRHSLHHFIGVVAHGEDAVCPVLRSVLEQQLVGFLTRLFAELR